MLVKNKLPVFFEMERLTLRCLDSLREKSVSKNVGLTHGKADSRVCENHFSRSAYLLQ